MILLRNRFKRLLLLDFALFLTFPNIARITVHTRKLGCQICPSQLKINGGAGFYIVKKNDINQIQINFKKTNNEKIINRCHDGCSNRKYRFCSRCKKIEP